MSPPRSISKNDNITIATLANYGDEVFGINLATKALMRFEINSSEFPNLLFNPLAIWEIEVNDSQLPFDPARPEFIEVKKIAPVGQIRKKRMVATLCNAANAPTNLPLLGFNGPSISYNRVTGKSPSVTIIELTKRQAIRKNSYGEITISFPWGPIIASLPIVNDAELQLFGNESRSLNSDKEISEVLGFKPKYLVVALAKPHAGYCKKVCAGLLPNRLSRKSAKLLLQHQVLHDEAKTPNSKDFQILSPLDEDHE